jgi:predicted transcriptional regulator of viral defense system
VIRQRKHFTNQNIPTYTTYKHSYVGTLFREISKLGKSTKFVENLPRLVSKGMLARMSLGVYLCTHLPYPSYSIDNKACIE